MTIHREPFYGGVTYICDCGARCTDFYPTDMVETSANRLWDENRDEAIKRGVKINELKHKDNCNN